MSFCLLVSLWCSPNVYFFTTQTFILTPRVGFRYMWSLPPPPGFVRTKVQVSLPSVEPFSFQQWWPPFFFSVSFTLSHCCFPSSMYLQFFPALTSSFFLFFFRTSADVFFSGFRLIFILFVYFFPCWVLMLFSACKFRLVGVVFFQVVSNGFQVFFVPPPPPPPPSYPKMALGR